MVGDGGGLRNRPPAHDVTTCGRQLASPAVLRAADWNVPAGHAAQTPSAVLVGAVARNSPGVQAVAVCGVQAVARALPAVENVDGGHGTHAWGAVRLPDPSRKAPAPHAVIVCGVHA